MEVNKEGNREAEIFSQLQSIKEVRTRTIQLEKIRSKLKQEFETTENEKKCIKEFKGEMELLQQEKMAHVEELRLIHADINVMETTIKQSEDERIRSFQSAKHMYQEYIVLKSKIDDMRCAIGLDRLPDVSEEAENLTSEYFNTQEPELRKSNNQTSTDTATTTLVESLTLSAASTSHGNITMSHISIPHPKPESRQHPTSFRQQAPPMKTCLSCHQQIHRNAPICPLCKAKSRSKNPKKPKRKLDD